jgi:hypothetical protein
MDLMVDLPSQYYDDLNLIAVGVVVAVELVIYYLLSYLYYQDYYYVDFVMENPDLLLKNFVHFFLVVSI